MAVVRIRDVTLGLARRLSRSDSRELLEYAGLLSSGT